VIILIEGMDCTGKTTLSKNLLRVLNFEYLKGKGPFNSEKAVDFMKSSLVYCDKESRKKGVYFNLIWERCPIISHLVYSPIVDRVKVEEKIVSKFKRYQSLLISMETIIVYCKASPETVKKRLKEDSVSIGYLKDSKTELLLEKYDEIINSDYNTIPTITLNSSIFNEKEMACETLRQLIKVFGNNYIK